MVAGEGNLPMAAAEAMEKEGCELLVLAIEGAASPSIETPGRSVIWIPFGKLQAIIDQFREQGLKDLLLIGRIKITSVIHQAGDFDARLTGILARVKGHRGNAILAAIVEDLEGEGFRILSNIDAAPRLVTPEGLLAGPDPGEAAMVDVRFAWPIAKWTASRDIGQTIVARNMAVVAVEAMEGTNRTIRRAGDLVGSGMAVVKVAGPDHDFRFDVPTIGPKTVEVLAEGGGGVLAVEAGRSFILEREKTYRTCLESGVSLVGFAGT
jgi:DUF1009 family protein